LCIALIWTYALHVWQDDLDAAEQVLAGFAECARIHALGPYILAAEGLRGDLAIRRGQGAARSRWWSRALPNCAGPAMSC
jgi:hypothetical protein